MTTILKLSEDEKENIGEAILEAGNPYQDPEGFLLNLHPIFSVLPENMLRPLFDFKNDPQSSGSLVLKNFPTDDRIPATPKDGKRAKTKKTFISEGCLLGIAKILGEPFAYHHEKEGELVHNICPIAEHASSQSNAGSKVDMNAHIDIAFDPNKPHGPYNEINADYLLLGCLRADKHREGATTYIEARDIVAQVSPEEIELLRKPLFSMQPPYSFVQHLENKNYWSHPTPILSGQQDSPEIAADFGSGMKGLTAEAERVLKKVANICLFPSAKQSLFLEPGDIVLINNRKGLHGRNKFPAKFDGTDRWLQRVYVRNSLWELRKKKFARIF
jgi:L-asparagine oxygenase